MPITALLPEEVAVDGEWNAVLMDLYRIFSETFIDDPVRMNGRKVIFDRRKIDDDLEEGFWHLITRKQNGERLPDFARARKLNWIRPICENIGEQGVSCWRYLEGSGRWRVYLWLEEENYVLIFEELTYVYKIVTSFSIDASNDYLRRDLERKRTNGEPI